MTFLNPSKCSDQQQFMTKLKEIDETLFSQGPPDQSKVDTISKFFENNADFIGNDKTAAIRFHSIGAKIRTIKTISSNDPIIGGLQNYVRQLLPSSGKEEIASSCSFLKQNSKNYIRELANWINLMEIPLSSLNISEKELCDLFPHLRYVDLCNIDISKYDLGKFKLNFHDRNFQLKTSDKETRFNIAKHYTMHDGLYIIQDFNNFGIEDKTHLFEIIKLCAQKNGLGTAETIKTFGIEDKKQLFEIAKLCALQNGGMGEYIENFGIKDQKQLIEIATICIQQNSAEAARSIHKFEIEDKLKLFELAKFSANTNTWTTAAFIDNFGIVDQAHIFEIAKVCAEKSGFATTSLIKNFKIVDQIQLYKIAKLCAQQDSEGTAENIKNFGLKDNKHLFKIAKLCAQQNGGGTVKHIQKFGIEDQEQLFEIAKLCAQQNGKVTAEHIKNFRIEDPRQLYEIAKLCAKQDGNTIRYIANFGIKDQEQLYEVIKLCAQQNGSETAINFPNLGIKDKAQVFEIAKLCAQQNGQQTAYWIKNFKIEDKAELFEIAKLCAQQNGGTATYIDHFGITDEEQLYEIAMLCARQNGNLTALYIQRFGIQDKMHLFEIAKMCAQSNGAAQIANRINDFKIVDKAHLFQIAKLCAQRDSEATSTNIKSFQIEDKEQLYEIIKLCALQNGEITAKNFARFEIEDPEMRWKLFLECFKADNNALHWIPNFVPLPDVLPLYPVELFLEILKSNSDEKEIRNEFFTQLKGMIDALHCTPGNKQKLVRISEEIAKLDIHIQNETATWFLKCLFLSTQFQSPLKQSPELNWMLESRLWDDLAKMREPRLRSLLTPGLFEFSQNNREVPNGAKGLPLIAIPFYQLQQQGVDGDKLKQITLKLKALQNRGNTLKNVLNVQTVLHMAHLLATTEALSLEQKILGIDKIFFNKDGIEDNAEELLKKINAARGLLQINNKEWPNSTDDPVKVFSALLESLIPIKDVKGVSERYNETFAKSRNPYGVITYAAGLKTLNEPAVMDCLGQYVSSVFNDKFKDTRYDTTRNPHLKTIAESHPNITTLWRKDIDKPISLEGEKKEDFDPKKWIELKLSKDKHFFGKTLPFIEDYYKTNTVEEREILSKKLNDELEKESDKTAFTTLKLQQACIALAEAPPENVIPILTAIQEYILEPHTGFATSEFAADIRGRLASNKTATELKIIFGDDPIDLLLSGTDVTGSCQRIGGDPNLNKGLLGYLMDGKIRLLAVKDGSGKIVARCMLRLLWDGQNPVIYRERFYPDNFDLRVKNAMNQAAKEIAERLDVPLTSGDPGTPYGKILQALGGPIPYEYSDGAGGVQKDGRYTITRSNLVVL